MRLKRALALLLAVLQLGWSLPVEALAQVAFRANVQTPTAQTPVVAVPSMGSMHLGMGGAALSNVSLSPTLPGTVGVLPTPRTRSAAASIANVGGAGLVGPGASVEAAHLAHVGHGHVAAPMARGAAVGRIAVQDGAGTGLKTASRRVGKALKLPGLGGQAGVEVSKGAAESVFAALRGERLISASGGAVVRPAAETFKGRFTGRASGVVPLQPLSFRPEADPAETGKTGRAAIEDAAVKPEAAEPSLIARLWQKPAVRWGAALAAGAGIIAALPLLAAHVSVVAGAGSIVLSAIGIPQIIKNLKEGREAVKDIPLATPLLWFAAAVMFSVVSIGQGASFWWVAANLAGVLESALIIGQVNYAKRSPKALLATGLTVAASLAPIPLIAMQVFMPLSSWLSVALSAALYLCWLINWPQIKSYYHLYREEGRRPEGLSPLWPGLVLLGSLLHLYAAAMLGDMSWVLNASVASLASSTVLSQYYFPRATNAFVGPAVRLVETLMGLLKKAVNPLRAGAKRAFIAWRKARYMPAARQAFEGLFDDVDYSKFADGDLEARLKRFVGMVKGLPGRSVVYLQAPTAAGKSTLAKRIKGVMGKRIKVFPVDVYFKDGVDVPKLPDGTPDYDRPDAILLDRAAADIKALLEGKSVEMPRRDFKKEVTEFETGNYVRLEKDEILIVDSIFASHPALIKAGVGHASLNVFLSAPTAARLARRLNRDKYERGRSIERNLKAWPRILKNERELILPLRHHADYFIEMTSREELAGLPETFAEFLAAEWAESGKSADLGRLFAEQVKASVARDKLISSEAFLTADLRKRLRAMGDPSYLSPETTRELVEALDITVEELVGALRSIAAERSLPSVSGRSVGAVGLGESGAVYLGANIELYAAGIEINIHAEQSVIMNAMAHDETGLKLIAVTANPCGHCRAFLNELISRKEIRFLIEGQERPATLAELYPMPYGEHGTLMAPRDNKLEMIRKPGGPKADLVEAAFAAANLSYSEGNPAGVALRTKDGRIYKGAYVEVSGHNPSLRPLPAALVTLRSKGGKIEDIVEAALVELKGAGISHRSITRRVLKDIGAAPLRTWHVRRSGR